MPRARETGTVSRTDQNGGAEPAGALDARIPELPLFDERRYEIAGEHARGGAGMVLHARDRLLRRPVAVKQPQQRQGAGRFLREALITARLQHPAIVPIYDFGVRSGGEPCYAMRLVPGATLRDALAAAPGLDDRLALLPHVQVLADAVAYAHSQRVLHRDLKPGNVLVGSFGETVVIDWGLAKDLESDGDDAESASGPIDHLDDGGSLTATGMAVGTPGYMPPEQALGEEVDERADVYAIGAILYHLLVGEPPYRGEAASAVLAGPPVPVEAREPGAPRDLVAVVNKAMASDPADRYPSARALAEDLKQFATGQLVGARQYSRWTLVRRWLRRHRATSLVGAALLLALVGGAGAVMVERSRTAVERDRATAENNRLRLLQAEALLERDPTAAAAWLKLHRAEGALVGRAVEVAARAEAAGVARHVLTLPGDTPLRVCLDGSGRQVGVLGRDGAIWLFDLARGTRRLLGKLPEAPVACLFATGANGAPHLVAAAGRRGGLMTAALPDGPARQMAVPGGSVTAVRRLDEGRLLVTGRDGRAHVLRVDGSQPRTLDNLPAGTANLVSAPDGSSLLAPDDGGVWRIPLDGGPAARLELPAAPVVSADVSSDGRQLVFATRGDLGVHELATGETSWRRGVLATTHEHTVRAVAGGVIVKGGPTSDVQWWDGRDGEVITVGPRAFVKSVEVTGEGRRAVWVDKSGTIFVADLPDQTVRTWVGHHTGVRSLATSGDGRWLAVTHGAAVRVFALPAATGARRIQLGARTGIKVPDARSVPARGEVVAAVRQREIVAFDARTGAPRPLLTLPAPVNFLETSPGGKRVAVHAHGGRVVVVDLETAQQRQLEGASSYYQLDFAGDDRLAGLDAEGNVHLWDLARDSHRIVTRVVGGIGGVSGSADGSRLLAGSLREGVLIDLDTDRTSRLDYGGRTFFRSGMTPDGRKVAIGFGDGRVVLWELQAGQLRSRVLTRREGYAVDLLFTRDQQALVIADDAGTLCRVDLDSGKVREIGRHPARIVAASLSPSQRWLATVDSASEIRIWEPETGGLAVLRGSGERNVSFMGDDRLVAIAAEGWLELIPFSPGVVVPNGPAALSRWLAGLTTAQVNGAGDVVSPY